MQWGTEGSGDGQFRWSEGVAVDGSGNVYVADYLNRRIQKFSSSGEFLAKWGTEVAPRGVAVDGSGNVYVSNISGRNGIQKFSSSGELLAEWGGPIVWGTVVDGQLHNPWGVAVDGSGNVYVAEQSPLSIPNRRIQKFSSTGDFLAKWGTGGSGDGQFGGDGPVGIAVDGSGTVYVTDPSNKRVQKFSSSGEFLGKWDESSTDGQFDWPKGIAVDGSGNVYLVDQNNPFSGHNGIQKFSSSGTLLAKWGTFGYGDGEFNNPVAVAVDGSDNVYVAEFYNRIQKFSMGP